MNFGRKVRRVARRQCRHGLMSRSDYRKVVTASRDPDMVAKWEAQVKRQVGAPWEASTEFGIDWSSIWEWFKENWPTILKILLTLLAFVEMPDEVKEEPTDEDE